MGNHADSVTQVGAAKRNICSDYFLLRAYVVGVFSRRAHSRAPLLQDDELRKPYPDAARKVQRGRLVGQGESGRGILECQQSIGVAANVEDSI